MANRALQFTALGPLEPNSRASLGVEIRGSGLQARPVVIVFLPLDATRDPARLAEIRARTESAVRLQHPNVIQVLGMEQLDDGWARIVEYAQGESLGRLLVEAAARKERPPPSVAAAILADACLGVHHAHETGESRDATRPQLHGGIRPATLIVTHAGRTKVTGYGAAIFAPTGKEALHPYLAPEQVLGGVDATTRQTDVYALGAVLYELIAGSPPFVSDEGMLDNQILTMRPSSLRVSDEAELGEIALKALSKKASDRYPTALAMREALLACRTAAPASPEVVVRWLESLLPKTHPERVARQALLDSAIATTGVITLPEEVGSLSGPVPTVIPPAPAPAASLPPPVPDARPPSPSRRGPARAISESEIAPYVPTMSEQVEIRVQSGRRAGMVAGIVAGMVIGGVAYTYWKGSTEEEQPTPVAVAKVDAGGLRGAPMGADGGTDGGSATVIDAGGPAAPLVVDAGPRMLSLEITTAPPMDIRVDGKAVGHEAVTVSLTEGSHRVEASDKALRAFAASSVELRHDHQKESLTVGSSQLAFDVPAGASITVDGKPYGTGPVEPDTLYSGTHEVVVDYNGATTTQTVHMHSDVNLTLTVHAN